jgi:hypothetical protein
VEAAGDHEVEDEEEFVLAAVGWEAEDDALADAAEGADGLAFDGGDGWDGRAEEEGRGDAEVFERLVEDARGEGCQVGRDVGEFRHG